jgi:hypothetical protein
MRVYRIAWTLLLSIAWCARGDVLLAEYNWGAGSVPAGGSLAVEGNDKFLRIRNTNAAPLRVQLLNVTNPPITSPLYVLRGEVR